MPLHPLTGAIVLFVLIQTSSSQLQQMHSQSRGLQQSNTCSPNQWIPKCQVCRLVRLESAGMQTVPVCWKCQPPYQRINKGRACVCDRGRYDDGSQCLNCGAGYYCPVISSRYVALPGDAEEQRGRRVPCDRQLTKDQDAALGGLTTTKQRATEWTDCVAKPGYYLTSLTGNAIGISESTQTAAVCGDGRYSPGYRRLTACLPCPKGLVTLGNAAANHDAQSDCILPPGTYYIRGVGYPCPVGLYREQYVPFLMPNSLPPECTPCGLGIATPRMASGNRTECHVVQPGFGAIWNPGGYAENATLCPHGSYWPGGPIGRDAEYSTKFLSCRSCGGYLTRSVGSTKASDCLAPPGYYLDASSQPARLRPCPFSITAAQYGINPAYGTFGTYRSGWASTPNGIRDCKVCGVNMKSLPSTPNTHPDAEERAKNPAVAADPTACFVPKGQGLQRDFNLPVEVSQLKVINCPSETSVGANSLTFGVSRIIPCKPIVSLCGRGYRYSSATQRCFNPAGYGAYSSSAEACIPGSWAAEDSSEPCVECPSGRETKDYTLYQSSSSHCYVKKGHGVYNANAVLEEDTWFDQGVNLPVKISQQAQLEVQECPVGRYSTSTSEIDKGHIRVLDVGARCERCPQYSSTVTTGASGIEDCKVCAKGTGTSATSGKCEVCPRGSFNNGESTHPYTNEDRDSYECLACPLLEFQYPSQPSGITKEVPGTTRAVATESDSSCVPRWLQPSMIAGTSILHNETGSNMLTCITQQQPEAQGQPQLMPIEDCWSLCWDTYTGDPACIAMEFHYDQDSASGSGQCCLLLAKPGTSGEVYFKLPPSNDPRAGISSVVPSKGASQSVASQGPPVHTIHSHWGSISSTGGFHNSSADARESAEADGSRVKVSSVFSGLYVRHTFSSNELQDHWGPVLEVVDDSALTDSEQQAAAAESCNLNAKCWGFTKLPDGGYALRTGSDIDCVRTVVVVERDSQVDLNQDSQQIVYPGRTFEATTGPCTAGACGSHGACVPQTLTTYYCECQPGWLGALCDVPDPSPCAPYRRVSSTTALSPQCLAELWESVGCTNKNYILSAGDPRITAWTQADVAVALDSMYSLQQQAQRVFESLATPWNQWSAEAIQSITACYGTSRTPLIGAMYQGYQHFAKDFAVQCAPGHFIRQFTVSAESAVRAIIPVCDDGTTDGKEVVAVGSTTAAGGEVAASNSGFIGISLQIYEGYTVLEEQDSTSSLYISALSFVAANSSASAIAWHGAYAADRMQHEVQCSEGTRVTGLAGVLLYDLTWGTSDYLPASVQLICGR